MRTAKDRLRPHRRRRGVGALVCVLAMMYCGAVLPGVHVLVHVHEHEHAHEAEHEHEHAHEAEHEREHAHEHEHEHEQHHEHGAPGTPHGQGSAEHLSICLVAAGTLIRVPPPERGGPLPAPLQREGHQPRLILRPNLGRGPPPLAG